MSRRSGEFAKTLLNQMTNTAYEDGDSLFGDMGDGPLTDSHFPIQTFGDRDYGLDNDEERRRRCIRDKKENCRNEYNADMFEAHAVAIAAFAGCSMITAGSGVIYCAAGGVAIAALGIAAARQRRQACERDAQWACQF